MLSNREQDYVQMGVGYYVAGRSAYLNGFLPVTANLFHHGFEMLLKAKLIQIGFPPEKLRTQFGHELWQVWLEFKRLTNDATLDSCDLVVRGLDQWEDIRYPAFPGGKGLAMMGALLKEHRTDFSNQHVGPSSSYLIVLEEIDDLFEIIVRAFPLGPAFIRTLLIHGSAKADYEQENRHQIPLV